MRVDTYEGFGPEAVAGIDPLDLALDISARIFVNERANRS